MERNAVCSEINRVLRQMISGRYTQHGAGGNKWHHHSVKYCR